MNIAIIGAGWYGCHIALTLIQAGHDVKVFEKSDHAISGASKKNQNRLHLGFHYPRDHQTRVQSKEGYEWFIEHYEHLTGPIENNIYAVADDGSIVDGDTFKIIMKGTGLDYSEDVNSNLIDKFASVNSLITCNERVVKNNLASRYFSELLNDKIVYNQYVDLSNPEVLSALKNSFDYVIDCTWGTARKINGIKYYYEPCVYFYYKTNVKDNFALTIMDGEFYSLYPYYDDIYTLTSVKHTPLGQSDEFNEALSLLHKVKNNTDILKQKREIFESEFVKFYPDFLNDFEFVDIEFSMKTKVVSNTDFRGCLVTSEDNLISVFSGKIDTLHIAEKKVFEVIHDKES